MKLTAHSVSKSYGRVRALSQVEAEFHSGEIHAVLGENGAGKSTLMHVLSGFTVPDSGQVLLDGKPLPLGHPFECRKRGVALVHQHFTLVPAFSVRENLALARLTHLGPADLDTLIADALATARDLGWEIDPEAVAGELPVGAQQRVEILKALAGQSEVIIFDEPTAVLSQEEVEDLFRVMRQLRANGRIVILIAHKLQEVLSVADRVTVLRRGVKVAEALRTEVDASKLAEWMVGELPPARAIPAAATTSKGLSVRSLLAKGDRGEDALRGISFSVDRGEIVGFGGVDGNGQVELAEALAGVRSTEGTIEWDGGAPKIAYIPQDRQTDGLALRMSVEDNLLITGHNRPSLGMGPFLSPRRSRRWSEELIARFQIKVDRAGDPVSSLSGGNQQKVVVARALDETPDLLVAVNPTRGLDVKATAYVHDQILAAKEAGAAVVLISTDLDELAALASRTYFLSRGSLVEGQGAAAVVGGVE